MNVDDKTDLELERLLKDPMTSLDLANKVKAELKKRRKLAR